MVEQGNNKERPLWFLTLTQSCNLACRYCGSDENFDMEDLSPHPKELAFDLTLLKRLLPDRTSPDTVLPMRNPPVICFYGGEPLLRTDLIYKVMDEIVGLPLEKEWGVDYVLQTNGTLLNELDDAHLHRITTILISVDGDKSVTDTNRGTGTYERAFENVKAIKTQRGFKGDVIARMTVGEWSEIDRDVMFLANAGVFDHVHWQIDCLWDSPRNARWTRDFTEWKNNSYNPGMTRLCQTFAQALLQGKVIGIAPLLGMTWSVLANNPAHHVRCDSGNLSFNITTGGLITACPIAADAEPVGKLSAAFNPASVIGSEPLGGEGRCERCEIFGDCGGRCLYCSRTDWWGSEGFDDVCGTVKHLSKEIRSIVVPAAKEAIAKGLITLDQLKYPPFNNTVEIIP